MRLIALWPFCAPPLPRWPRQPLCRQDGLNGLSINSGCRNFEFPALAVFQVLQGIDQPGTRIGAAPARCLKRLHKFKEPFHVLPSPSHRFRHIPRTFLRRVPGRERSRSGPRDSRGTGAPAGSDRADRLGEHRLARRCWKRRARCSPTNTPKAIPAAATTAAASSSMSPRQLAIERAKAAVRLRLRQRAAPLGRAGEPGGLHGAAPAGRHLHGHDRWTPAAT